MTPLVVPAVTPSPAQTGRAPVLPPVAPATLPLSSPAMAVRVEWSGAVRPPDPALRALRPDLGARGTPDLPTGPPPAFSSNVLDQIPDILQRVADDRLNGPEDSAGPQPPGVAAPGVSAADDADEEVPMPSPAGGADAPVAQAVPAGYGAEAGAAQGQRLDMLL